MKLKKGDKVIVIAGKSRGETSTIVRVIREKNLVVLDKTNLVKKHRKPNQTSQKGQIIDKVMPLHVSNVMLVDPKTGKPTRVRIVRDEKAGRSRVAVKSGQAVK